MFRGSITTILFSFLLIHPAVYGQTQQTDKVWTLQECLDYAINNNINLKQTALDIMQSELTLQQSQLSRYPGVSASSSYGFGFGRAANQDGLTINANAQSGSFSVGAAMPLFNGFAIRNTVRMNKLGLELSGLNQKAQEDIVSLQVLGAYLSVLLFEEDLKRAEVQILVSKDNLENSRKLVNGGVIPEGNLRELEAQLASDELFVIQSRNNLVNAYLTLALAMQLDLDDVQQVEIPTQSQVDAMLIAEEWNSASVYDYASRNLAQYASNELAVEFARQNVEVAKSGYYPSLNLSGGVGTNFFKPLDDPLGLIEIRPQFGDNFNQSIGVSLNVPIFNNGLTRLNVETAQIGVERQKVANEQELNLLRQNIQQAVADATAAAASYTAALRLVNARENALDFADKKFQAGSSTAFEFSNAQNLLTAADADLIRSKYNFLFARLTLEYYQGRPVTFN